MILRNTLIEVLRDQRPPVPVGPEIARSVTRRLPTGNTQHALVLTGVRRCGKSVLQAQLLRTHPGALYVNVEDTRLYGMGPEDFPALQEVIQELVLTCNDKGYMADGRYVANPRPDHLQ